MSEYTPHNWVNNETITAERMNNLEQAVASASSNVGGLAIRLTMDESGENGTADKTWQEVYDALNAGSFAYVVEVINSTDIIIGSVFGTHYTEESSDESGNVSPEEYLVGYGRGVNSTATLVADSPSDYLYLD